MERWAAILALGIGGCAVSPASEPAPATASPGTDRAYFVQGMGIVTNLNGTGDSPESVRALVAERLGPEVAKRLDARNVALVAVTGQVPAGARSGQSIPVQVSAVGEASSLRGGVLFLTALRTVDGSGGVLGIAQGALTVDSANPTSGAIEQGGRIEFGAGQ